jgi:D-alanine-D-alanine ligase
MAKKIKVGLLFGGKSAEHEVSLMSAKSVFENLDPNKYEIVLLGVDKEGHWLLNDGANFLLNASDPKNIAMRVSDRNLTFRPGGERAEIMEASNQKSIGNVDVVFSVIHGTLGEDGSIQGLLRVAGIPYVGPGVLSSAIGMDKDVSKRLLRDAGISIAKFVTYHLHQKKSIRYDEVKSQLGDVFFVKPANTGSSVGISKVKDKSQFDAAINEAFKYDSKILIEEFIKGREIEISVMGNEEPLASVPGEIVTHHEFYSYEAKYIDEKGATCIIPAKLDSATVKRIQAVAKDTYLALCCEGMARVDFFLTEDGRIVVNEINTLPGFTKISMYPKMWEAAGVPYKELLDKLIQYAIERHNRDSKIETNFKK